VQRLAGACGALAGVAEGSVPTSTAVERVAQAAKKGTAQQRSQGVRIML